MRALHSSLIWMSLLFAVFGLSALSTAQANSANAPGPQSGTAGDGASATSQRVNGLSAEAAALPANEAAVEELPESPGAVQFGTQAQNSSTVSLLATQAQSAESATPQQTQSPAMNASQAANPQQPVGTAAAAAPVVSGTAAARPAGIAVAPAKQHRVRTIVIRVGAIAGAAVALATVIALTEATGSRPPGAH
jgi:hypothetical protein